MVCVEKTILWQQQYGSRVLQSRVNKVQSNSTHECHMVGNPGTTHLPGKSKERRGVLVIKSKPVLFPVELPFVMVK